MAAYTTIDDPSAYFKVQLYTGDGNDSRTITFDDTDTDMQPDMVWIKERSSTSSHYLTDSVRGIGKKLEPDGAGAESTEGLSAVTSDGFTIGTSTNQVNQDTITHVAWCWKESADAGFDIVTYTGTGSAKTESHSLSAVPHFFVIKSRSDSGDWNVGHQAFTYSSNDYIMLSSTAALDQQSYVFNGTAPTSSVFSVGTGNDVNGSSRTYVAYLWTEKQGFSKFGSYTGNGNADGTFVYTGFKPAWILIKRTSTAGNDWGIFDNKRLGYNVDNEELRPSANDAEQTDDRLDILSNGFKIRLAGAGFNANGDTFIYMAFAEAPFVNSKGVPCNAR